MNFEGGVPIYFNVLTRHSLGVTGKTRNFVRISSNMHDTSPWYPSNASLERYT